MQRGLLQSDPQNAFRAERRKVEDPSFSCGPGWYPVSSDHYFYYTGGVGYTSVTYRGHQGYGYKGGFDCGGNDYYNSYWNTITGNSNGNWSCSYSYSWRKSLGFQYQAWCGSGIYGEK